MSAPFPPSEAVPNGLAPDDDARSAERKIHEILRNIRAEEVKPSRAPNFLSSFLFNIPVFRSAYLYIELVITENLRYLRWLYVTWTAVALRTWDSIFRPPPAAEESEAEDFGDWLSYVLFAFLATLVLPLVLLSCLISRFPPFVRVYYAWSALFGGDLGLINNSNPNLFKSLTVRQADAGKKSLAVPVEITTETDTKRQFNYDRAKILLQLASVVYEHSNDAIHNAAFGGLDFFGREFGFLESPGDATIRRFCRQFQIEYQPISELNNKSTAFAAVFWDPRSNWIVVSLKGTGPVEFGEWLSDLDATMVSCAEYIPGFQNVHKGFKDRVFPDKGRRASESHEQRPYNTISKSIKALVEWLSARNPGQKINVWFTGHSLGCATATLIYSRLLMKPEEVGENGVLRDAYLFAAPIVADPQSVAAFNKKIFEKGAPKRTMWRVTSNNDFVATGLPEYGDYLYILDPKALESDRKNNLFFSHFGSEIVLYDYPHSSNVTGNHIAHDHKVEIESSFSREDVAKFQSKKVSQLDEWIRVAIGNAVQRIPLAGRFIAHFPGYYWDQLDRVALGDAEWTVY